MEKLSFIHSIFLKKIIGFQSVSVLTLKRNVLERKVINMHRYIRLVLTVSTCLLNTDRRSSSDFMKSPFCLCLLKAVLS